jgi:3',5'-cyclic AMP phosphodiesterase CpdA
VKLGVIADSHVSVERFDPARWHNDFDLRGSRALLRDALRHELLDDVDVVVVLGDLAHYGDRASVRDVVDAVDEAARPTLLLQGNHDVLVPGVRLEEEAASSKFVACPFRAGNPDAPLEAFRGEGIGLDMHEVRAECSPGARWAFEVASQRMVDATGDAVRVLATHFPVVSLRRPARAANLLYSGHLSDLADDSTATVDRDRPTVVLSGHLHLRAVTVDGPMLQLAFAALVEPPFDVSAVEITHDGRVSYESASVQPVTVAADRVPVLAPSSGAWAYDGRAGRWVD